MPAPDARRLRLRGPLHLLAAALPLALASIAGAQTAPLDDTDHAAVVETIGTLLKDRYVFPDVAEACARHLDQLLSSDAFNEATDLDAFSEQLTTALRSISDDKHMLVRPRLVRTPPPGAEPEKRQHPLEFRARRLKRGQEQNFGFASVSRLDGNIGYLDLRSFSGEPEARDVAAAAMTMLANTDALIYDMRENTGGFPFMVCFMCSYLFDEPTHLNSLYWREGDRTDEFWTFEVPGTTRPDVPVFVLTSAKTFSGAEEFSYNLRTQNRAVLVGEVTRGGAHPSGIFPIDDRIEIIIPTGRAINPITGTNWEGTGVEPHVIVPADEALNKALELAAPAAKSFRAAKLERWDALDPWQTEARRLDDAGQSDAAATRLTSDLRSAHDLGLLHERDLNQYGYEFLGEKRLALSIAAFTLNVELYPDSANVYDSLGEALRAAGRIEESIANYERALELDSESENARNARAILEELRTHGK